MAFARKSVRNPRQQGPSVGVKTPPAVTPRSRLRTLYELAVESTLELAFSLHIEVRRNKAGALLYHQDCDSKLASGYLPRIVSVDFVNSPTLFS